MPRECRVMWAGWESFEVDLATYIDLAAEFGLDLSLNDLAELPLHDLDFTGREAAGCEIDGWVQERP